MVYKSLGHDRYVIRDIENCQLTQLPYDGIVEANKMRLWLPPPDVQSQIAMQKNATLIPNAIRKMNFMDFSPKTLIEVDQMVRLAEL